MAQFPWIGATLSLTFFSFLLLLPMLTIDVQIVFPNFVFLFFLLLHHTPFFLSNFGHSGVRISIRWHRTIGFWLLFLVSNKNRFQWGGLLISFPFSPLSCQSTGSISYAQAFSERGNLDTLCVFSLGFNFAANLLKNIKLITFFCVPFMESNKHTVELCQLLDQYCNCLLLFLNWETTFVQSVKFAHRPALFIDLSTLNALNIGPD